MIPIYPEGFPNSNTTNDSEIVIFEDPDNPDKKVQRTGKCNRCGQCCIDTNNIFAEIDGNGEPNPLTQVVPGMCAYFRWAEDGLAACVGRDTLYYKNGCAWWPSKYQHIENYDQCSYTFTDIIE